MCFMATSHYPVQRVPAAMTSDGGDGMAMEGLAALSSEMMSDPMLLPVVGVAVLTQYMYYYVRQRI